MRPDSFADRLLLVLGRRAPAYRWTVPASGFWATVAATMGRGPDGVLPPKADTSPAVVPAPRAPVRGLPRLAWPVPVSGERRPAHWRLAPAWVAAAVVALTGTGLLLGTENWSARPPGAAGSPPPPVTGQPGGTIIVLPPFLGEVLSVYDFTLGPGYSVFIGILAPTRPDQFYTAGVGDLAAGVSNDGPVLVPLHGNTMAVPSGSSGLTFQACRAGPTVDRVVVAATTSFCLRRSTTIAGIVAVPVSPTQLRLHVVIWH
jgi:hypothetical protein